MNAPRTTRRASLLALLICAGASAVEPDPPGFGSSYIPGGQIPLMPQEPVIDGVLDDASWEGALVQEITYEIQPGDNIAAPVQTTVRIGYTAEALFFAFRALDSDRDSIRARLRDRDNAFSDDWVGAFMDTFDDQRRGYELIVNPLGVQSDLINDQSTGEEDTSWDGRWTSAGRLTPEGYAVEMRIPFSTLRFKEGGQEQRWGISLLRNYPRDKRHLLASHPVPRESNCFLCTWAKYRGMAKVRPGRSIEVTPTLTVATAQDRPSAGASWPSAELATEPGVDVSWAPSPNMALNATLNPDFSQVETDQLQLNFNDSFALFFPEKRPFFLEAADYFTTPLNVLYTRQIADPGVGARVTGRQGRIAYGAFVARDATTLMLVPGAQGSSFRRLDQDADIAVARYRFDLDEHASFGVIGTSRHGHDYGNDVLGVDGRWQRGAHTATAQILASDSEYPAPIVAAYSTELGDDPTPSGKVWRAGYSFSNRNWNLNLQRIDAEPGFRADLGFMGQVGYASSVAGGGYTWYRDGESINRINVYGDWDSTYRFDGQLLERELEFFVNIQGAKQSQLNIGPQTRTRYWNGAMFDEHNLSLFGNFRPTANLQLGTYQNYGQQLDLKASRTGRRAMLGLWGNWAVGQGLNFEWDFSKQRLKRDGGTAFEAGVGFLRVGLQLDPRQRLRLTLQGSEIKRDQARYASPVNEVARDWGSQMVCSYKLNPRTAVYAGASYGAFMDDNNPDLFGNTRSVFLKLSYGWQP